MKKEEHEKKLLEIVARWPGIAPQAAFEQAMHELGNHSREREHELRDAMWKLLSFGDLIFTTDRVLRVS